MGSSDRPLKIAFIHPDLGIGGAERLVVDVALGLQARGNEVKFFTSHCDPNHCFEEIKNGTLPVEVFGDSLPTTVMGKFYIIFANLRQFFLTCKLVQTKQANDYDLFIVDQLSSCVPLLHMVTDAKILFYCHFPDQLMTERSSFLKKLYRIPFDLFEQFSISAADTVVVNSKFTRSMYHKSFPWLKNEPGIIYPCVDTKIEKIDRNSFDYKLYSKLAKPTDKFYLSINRFDRKKNISLALHSYALSEPSSTANTKLIICGGYDERVPENVQYLKELQDDAKELKMTFTTIFYEDIIKGDNFKLLEDQSDKQIIFLASISSTLKDLLLKNMELLLYTPTNEHFGIVPLEAMKFGKPVIATNTGGPLETVVSYIPNENENTATGWLREPLPMVWAKAINEYYHCNNVDFEKNGKDRVRKQFSRDAMTDLFGQNFEQMAWKKKTIYPWESSLSSLIFFLLHVLVLRLLPGQSWPFLILAGLAGVVSKNMFWTIYFLLIFGLTAAPEESF